MEVKKITFVITTYKSEDTIYNCLNSLPKEVNKIIVENSKNIKLTGIFEQKMRHFRRCFA